MPTDPAEELDPVEELIAVCLETPLAERPSTVERLCSDHPDLAGELRRRMASLQDALLDLSSDPSKIPDRLGDFRILQRLGGGGMGVVHEAIQESLGRSVALKLIRPEHLWFERSRERFRREIEAVARLEHPGIVPVYVVGEEHGLPYFAMERVHGCTLAEVLKALADRAPESLSAQDLSRVVLEAAGDGGTGFEGSWIDACLSITRQIAEALQHAHERGVVHRDVKPSNVMLSSDGRARLIDFGLTMEEGGEHVTRTGAVMGTFPYTAPEQLRDAREADGRSDVYSLGATLYELLALQPPFGDERTPAALSRIMQGGPDPIRARNRRVAADVETACLVAMDVEPGRRYADAAAFARDLANLEARRPIEARPPGRLLRLRRLVQRHPAWTTATVLGTMLAVGLPTSLYVQSRGHATELGNSLTEAERMRDETDRSVRFLTELFQRVSPYERPGPPATVVDMLGLGDEYVDGDLADYPYARGVMQLTLGQLLGEYGQAERAADLYRRALGSFDQSEDQVSDSLIMEARLSLTDELRNLGMREEAEPILREEVAIGRANDDRLRLRYALSRLAALLGGEEACEVYAELLPLLEGDSALAGALNTNRIGYGRALFQCGRHEDSEAQTRLGKAGFEQLYATPHPRLAQASVALAHTLRARGEREEAEQLYLSAIEMAETIWNGQGQVSAASATGLADIYGEGGDLERAEEYGRLGLELMGAATADGAPATHLARLVLARILVDRGEDAEGAELLERVISFERRSGVLGPERLGSALYHLGCARAELGRNVEAAGAFDEAIELWEGLDEGEADVAKARKARSALGEQE